MEKAIVIENLSKLYKNRRGITDINIEVESGEIFGFLGPNGAGKTTAMKIMTGLMEPDRGDVRIGGYSIAHDYEKAMRLVGCIIESVAMFGYMTAYENMRLCARFYPDIDRGRIESCLAAVGMLPFKDERVKSFSLGMRQRMGIAMAMLPNPPVLILDEPLNGLDVEGMVEMRHLIQSMAAEHGTTFFISSHLIHDVELTCSKIGILYEGKLLNVARTSDVLKNYSSLENFYLSEVGPVVKPESSISE